MCVLTVAAPAVAGGTLICVIYDRAVHLDLNASYDYGVSDSVTDASGSAELKWEGTPVALSKFVLTHDMLHRVKLSGEELVVEILGSAKDGDRTAQVQITITGTRVKSDKTTFRSSYHLNLGRVLQANVAQSAAKASGPLKTLHSVDGYAECSTL